MAYRSPLVGPSAIVAASQVGTWAIIASGDWPPSGYPLDDAWIHELVARNLVQHGVLGVNPHLYGSGATSTLWALILAIGAAFSVPPPWFSNGLNLLLLVLTGQLVLRLLVNDGVSSGKATALAAVFGCAPNFVWFALSGMEATFVAFASVAAVFCWFSPNQRVRHLAGVAAAMLSLARPEGVLIVPLLLALRWPKSRSEWASAVLVPALAVSLNALANLLLAGRLLPSTFSGRRWLWLAGRPSVGPIGGVQRLVSDWLLRLEDFTVGSVGPRWVMVGAACLGLIAMARRRGARALIAWTLVWFGVYAVALPTYGHGGRYQPLIPPLFLMLCCAPALYIGEWLYKVVPGNRRLLAAALAALTAVVLWKGPGSALLVWREDHRDAVRHVNETEIATGLELRTLPADARIASFDIGGIGYFSERSIVDIGGLTDSSMVPLLWQGRVAEYLKSERVTYLVLPLGFGPLSTVDGWNLDLSSEPGSRAGARPRASQPKGHRVTSSGAVAHTPR